MRKHSRAGLTDLQGLQDAVFFLFPLFLLRIYEAPPTNDQTSTDDAEHLCMKDLLKVRINSNHLKGSSNPTLCVTRQTT